MKRKMSDVVSITPRSDLDIHVLENKIHEIDSMAVRFACLRDVPKDELAAFFNDNKLDVVLLFSRQPREVEISDGFDFFQLPGAPHESGLLLWNVCQIALVEMSTECKHGSVFKFKKDKQDFRLYLATNPVQPMKKTYVQTKNFILVAANAENKSSFGRDWQPIPSAVEGLRILTGENTRFQQSEQSIIHLQWPSKHSAKQLVLEKTHQSDPLHKSL